MVFTKLIKKKEIKPADTQHSHFLVTFPVTTLKPTFYRVFTQNLVLSQATVINAFLYLPRSLGNKFS